MPKGFWGLTLPAFLGLASLKSFARRIGPRSGLIVKSRFRELSMRSNTRMRIAGSGGLIAKQMTMNRHAKAASALALLSLSVFVSGCCEPGYPCENTGSGSLGPLGPSKGEIVGISVGAAAVSALVVAASVEASRNRHILKGCVATGPDGLQLTRDSDKKVFSLINAPADIQPGEKVKLHGTKQKKQKGSPGNQQFVVERVTKDFGRCEASASAATPISAPSR